MVDFHSHILPGVDDGSASLSESIAMLRAQGEQGIRLVAATPHFYPRHDSPEEFLTRRTKAAEALRRELDRHPGLPEVIVGAEVHFFSRMSESDLLRQLTIGGKSCILIEMPMNRWTEEMYRELENISVRQGLTPIVAHVDRYISPFRTHGIPRALSELPVYVQANGEFYLNRATSGMALRLLKNGNIHLLGSDCHNMTARKPNLGAAAAVIRKKLGSEALKAIRQNERDILGL